MLSLPNNNTVNRCTSKLRNRSRYRYQSWKFNWRTSSYGSTVTIEWGLCEREVDSRECEQRRRQATADTDAGAAAAGGDGARSRLISSREYCTICNIDRATKATRPSLMIILICTHSALSYFTVSEPSRQTIALYRRRRKTKKLEIKLSWHVIL